MAKFLKYTGKDNANGYSVIAFAPGLLVSDAIDEIVKAEGDNGLTHKALFAALDTIHEFGAGGMFGRPRNSRRRVTTATSSSR